MWEVKLCTKASCHQHQAQAQGQVSKCPKAPPKPPLPASCSTNSWVSLQACLHIGPRLATASKLLCRAQDWQGGDTGNWEGGASGSPVRRGVTGHLQGGEKWPLSQNYTTQFLHVPIPWECLNLFKSSPLRKSALWTHAGCIVFILPFLPDKMTIFTNLKWTWFLFSQHYQIFCIELS